MSDNPERKWLAKLAKLRTDRRGNPAPHKPLLLLVVIDLAEQGVLPEKLLPLTPELAFQFCTYWRVVAHRRTQKPEIRFPFFHIQSDGFWKALDGTGSPTTDRHAAKFAELDPEFEASLKDSSFREVARKILISGYFTPPERVGLCALLGLPVLTEEDVANSSASQFAEEAELRGREGRFRLRVVSLYNYTCALTGYRLMTVSASSIIDAAHIHQFADSRNNEIRNGLALCKNAHWLFDNGLWTIADNYTVRVALGHFTEDSPDQKRLSDYHGQMIRLPSDPALSPDPVHLRWHRKQRFRGPV